VYSNVSAEKPNSASISPQLMTLPPFLVLNLIPKSLSGPPGLWLAVKIMPPVVFLFLIRCDTAGVDSSP